MGVRRWLSMAVIVGLVWGSSLATAEAVELGGKEIAVDLTQSYNSRYIWRGYDLAGNNDPVYQPAINIGLWDSGVWLNVWGSFALQGKNEAGDELDYTIGWDASPADWLDTSIGYTYFDFPNSSKDADINEVWASFAFTQIPLTPTYGAFYDWPAFTGPLEAGWYHSFGLSHDFEGVPMPWGEQTLSLAATAWLDAVWDTGDPQFSNVTFDLSTDFAWDSVEWLTVSPHIHKSLSTHDVVGVSDEWWGGVDVNVSL